jgi:hypothetical protein
MQNSLNPNRGPTGGLVARGLVPALAICALLPVLAAGQPAAQCREQPGKPTLLPSHSCPHGKTYGEWGEAWWKWVMSIPANRSPLLDTNGAFAAEGQNGPVWFLAGTVGGAATRTCNVPLNKALFFPLVNYINDYPCPGGDVVPPRDLPKYLADGAHWIINHVTELKAEVDGVALPDLWQNRGDSGLFLFKGDPTMAQVDPCITGRVQPGYSDGYWVMLAPLPAGRHTIHFGGKAVFSLANGDPYDWTVDVDVTYKLAVQDTLGKFEEAYWRWAFGNLTLPVDKNGNAVICEDVVMMPIPASPGDGTPGSMDVTINEDQAFMLPLWCWLGNDYTDGSVDPAVDVDVFRTLDITFKIDQDTVVSTKNVTKYYSDFYFVPPIPYASPPYVSFVYFQGVGVLYPGLSPGKHTLKLDAKNTESIYGQYFYEYHNTWNVTVKPRKDHGNHR